MEQLSGLPPKDRVIPPPEERKEVGYGDMKSIIRMYCKNHSKKRLIDYAKGFLAMDIKRLQTWKGTWTTVQTAKIIEIWKKRGVQEELIIDERNYGKMRNAISHCTPYYPPPEKGVNNA